MRVISGSARGHKLLSVNGMNTRPTQDRVKESVFNIIRNYVYNAVVLDLFSGTGNLAIEALSRGSKQAIMVDKSKESIEVIKKNLISTKLIEKSEIHFEDVESKILKLGKSGQKFDIIFMDPPYNTGFVNSTLQNIDKNNILRNEGIIVVERHKNDIIVEEDLENLKIFREKKYGDTFISFLGEEQI